MFDSENSAVAPDAVNFAQAPINRDLSAEAKVKILRDMVRIRQFELASNKVYSQEGAIGGFLHLYNGQESIAVGIASLLGEHDHMITAYRDHGHALAVGMGMNECMAELFGKRDGCSKGKGGSMHFFAPDKNYWGGHGIVGGQTPLGTGLAYGLKYHGHKGCCLCFLGDGAINQGAFHESLNLAALLDLPVIFVIENNGYSMGTSQVRSSAHPAEGLAARAEGYAMDWEVAEGFDVYQVREVVSRAIARAHDQSRPTLLELKTYRYYGHSVADANFKKYRTAEEITRHQELHDPIKLWQRHMLEEGVLDEAGVAEIDKAAKAEANAAVEFARASEFPSVEEITQDVYVTVDRGEDKHGRYFFH